MNNFYSCFKLIDGIPGWGQNILVIKAELLEDSIKFYKSAFGESASISLRYNQITNTGIYTEDEIIEKSKSVIGRAAIGSLFGPLGTIIGGISGTGSKKIKKRNYYYTIHFNSAAGEPGLITLGTSCGGCHWAEFDKLLKPHIQKTSDSAPSFL